MIRILSPTEAAAIRAPAVLVQPAPPAPPGPDPICALLDAGHELADDTEPGLRGIERLGLRLGVALLHAWLKPASCPAPS